VRVTIARIVAGYQRVLPPGCGNPVGHQRVGDRLKCPAVGPLGDDPTSDLGSDPEMMMFAAISRSSYISSVGTCSNRLRLSCS
jgi:hypothetical protein